MTTAGIYNVTAGRAEIRPDGSITFHSLRLKPAPMPEDARKPQSIEEVWKEDNNLGLAYSDFIRILETKGYKKNEILILTGKQVRALYRCLEVGECVPKNLSMVEVFEMFARTFKMKFKSHNSLQRLRDIPDDIEFWLDAFAFCVRDSNATQDSDGPQG